MGLQHARQATLQTLKTRTPTRVKCCLNYTAHSTHCHCYSPTTQPQKSTDIQCAHQPLPMSPFVAGLASKGVQALAGGVAGGPAVMPNQPAQPASPTSQPTSQPASQPTSQPAVPSPHIALGTIRSFHDDESKLQTCFCRKGSHGNIALVTSS